MRCLYTLLLSDLISWASKQGIHLAYGEGLVAETDRFLRRKAAQLGSTIPQTVTLHKWAGGNGAHFTGLGHDLIMYRLAGDGKLQPVDDGDDPAWLHVGQQWERMHSDCRWGGRFADVDSNHFSMTWNGVM